MNNASRLLFFLLILAVACKTREKGQTLLKSESPVDIEVLSSCKLPSVNALKDDTTLKSIIRSSALESIQVLKLKLGSSLTRSDYRIIGTKLIIRERCGVQTKNSLPFISLTQVLTLEHITSGKRTDLVADTIYIEERKLNEPLTLVPKPIKVNDYLPGLTKKSYKQVKLFFSSAK